MQRTPLASLMPLSIKCKQISIIAELLLFVKNFSTFKIS